MDSATLQMLEAVRKRKANLEKIEALILEEFGQPASATAEDVPRPKRAYKRKHKPGVPELTRRLQIHAWLKANGPASRAEIIKGSGLPDGTVGGYLSSEKDLFENRDGKWHAR